MQFEAHSDCRSHHFLQEVKVSKNPLVFGGNAEVAFKQGVETVQERFQTLWGKVEVCGEEVDRGERGEML